MKAENELVNKMASYESGETELEEFLDFISSYLDRSNVNTLGSNGKNILHYLCNGTLGGLGDGIPDTIRLLKQLGVNIDHQNDRGITPLLSSCHYIRSDDHEYIDEINEVLIELGANVTLADYDGITPLHVAFVHDDIPLAFYLLKNGADPKAKTTGVSGLYNQRLILTSNHSGVEVPLGTKAEKLVSSVQMKKLVDIYNSAPQLFKDTAIIPDFESLN